MPNNDDIQLKSYQDDLEAGETPDPFMDEAGQDPTKELGVPVDEFKNEIDKQDSGADDEIIDDDQREFVEDLDEDDKD